MRNLILLLSFFTWQQAKAQSPFRDVTAAQFGDSILLNWTRTAGNTCFDMHLQRSDGTTPFTTVFSVPGICGGTQDQYYSLVDYEDLKSGITYQYRLTASNDAFISDSVLITYIDAGDRTLFVYPNPTKDHLELTIDNSLQPSFLIEVFDISGKRYSLSTYPSNLVTLPTSDLSPGIYNLIVTTRDGQKFASDFIVQ